MTRSNRLHAQSVDSRLAPEAVAWAEAPAAADPAITSGGGDTAQAAPEAAKVVRLSVNLAPSVAAALKALAEKQNVTVTEMVRRTIALSKLLDDEYEAGNRITVVEGAGDRAKYRELVFL